MALRTILLGIVAFPALVSVAAAADVNDQTRCPVATKAFDDKDMTAIREIGLYIANTMRDLDLNHTDNGEPGILAQMTDEARATAVVAAIEFCRQHPRATIYNEAGAAYDGLRDMELELGGAK